MFFTTMNQVFKFTVLLIIVPLDIYAQFHFTSPGGAVDIQIDGFNDLPSFQATITVTGPNGHTEKHVVNSLWPNYNGQSSSVSGKKSDEDDGAFSNANIEGFSIGGNTQDNEISFERDDTALCTRCDDSASECEIIDQPQPGGNTLLRTRNCRDGENTVSSVSKQVPNKDGIKQISKRMIEIE